LIVEEIVMSHEPSTATRSLSHPACQAGLCVRRATQEDFPAALELVNEYFEAVDVWVRDTESEVRDYLVGADRGIWLAFIWQEPVGCIVLHPLASLARRGELKRLYVKPAYRRQGLAEGLLQAAEECAAKTAQYEWLYLDSKDDLVSAIRFYERHGYEYCDRYNANPQATVFMRKRVARSGRTLDKNNRE
jgi:ribosomal protein S18 acetylase RimI-like enzyme